ncbi:hypothetical protein FJTKL_05790 [Diaporthe vaccinii]|uniref:Uncharacterized protein n=1 Tax=Diaporthe vaccinii TaxID=105482 RepID=A0ABR4EY08_9PEZI
MANTPRSSKGSGSLPSRQSRELSTCTRLGFGISLDAQHHTGFTRPGRGVLSVLSHSQSHTARYLSRACFFPFLLSKIRFMSSFVKKFGTRDHRNLGLTDAAMNRNLRRGRCKWPSRRSSLIPISTNAAL